MSPPYRNNKQAQRININIKHCHANLTDHGRTATTITNQLEVSLKPALHPFPNTTHTLTKTNIKRPLVPVVMTK